MIKPEIGMPVIFHYGGATMVAFVEYVWNDGCVNLVAFSSGGATSKYCSVLLHQGFDGQPNPTGDYWCQFPNWFLRLMPPMFVFDPKAAGMSVAGMDLGEVLPHKIWMVQPQPQFAPPAVADTIVAEWQKTSQVKG